MALIVSRGIQAAADPITQVAQLGRAFSAFAKVMEIAKHVDGNESADPVLVQCVGCKNPAITFGLLSVLLMCKACLVMKEDKDGLNAFMRMQPLFQRYVALVEKGGMQEKQNFVLDVCREMAYVCDRGQSSLLEPIRA